jgi:Angiotensin-converting enzyme
MICFTRQDRLGDRLLGNGLRSFTSILLSCETLWTKESFSHAFEPISLAESAAASTERPHSSSVGVDMVARTISTLYENKEAGKRLAAMLEMGESRPWPEALQALTGQREMDATAILDYFAPLKKWLGEQNRGKPVGW